MPTALIVILGLAIAVIAFVAWQTSGSRWERWLEKKYREVNDRFGRKP